MSYHMYVSLKRNTTVVTSEVETVYVHLRGFVGFVMLYL